MPESSENEEARGTPSYSRYTLNYEYKLKANWDPSMGVVTPGRLRPGLKNPLNALGQT